MLYLRYTYFRGAGSNWSTPASLPGINWTRSCGDCGGRGRVPRRRQAQRDLRNRSCRRRRPAPCWSSRRRSSLAGGSAECCRRWSILRWSGRGFRETPRATDLRPRRAGPLATSNRDQVRREGAPGAPVVALPLARGRTSETMPFVEDNGRESYIGSYEATGGWGVFVRARQGRLPPVREMVDSTLTWALVVLALASSPPSSSHEPCPIRSSDSPPRPGPSPRATFPPG